MSSAFACEAVRRAYLITILNRGAGKSPEPAGWKACATDREPGRLAIRDNFKMHPCETVYPFRCLLDKPAPPGQTPCMAFNPESRLDTLWQENSLAFGDFDDRTINEGSYTPDTSIQGR